MRIGLADRAALLATSTPDGVVRWTGMPLCSPSWWSPDGAALLVTVLDKELREFSPGTTWHLDGDAADLGF